LVVDGHIDPEAIPSLCRQLALLIDHSQAELVGCDLAGLRGCDLVAVDALARLQLTAKRLGRAIRLCRASDQLVELVALAGLREILPVLEQ
jgi:ABC-type transporter Mla MlaB component